MKLDKDRRGFGSDNHSGAHPKILASLAAANLGHQPSYGTDSVTLEAEKTFKALLGDKVEVHFVFNGTAANVLALSAFVQPYHSVLASQHAHLINDECGAPEKYLGAKVVSIASADAKLRPDDIRRHAVRRGDQHFSQVRAVSITQPTELGKLYSLEELRAVSAVCQKENLVLHIDGARLVNAAAALGCSLKEIAELADVISFGGTKNGLVFGEAVVFTNRAGRPERNPDFKYIRKQVMQLPSKTRFISAQFLALLTDDLWLENAKHANAMAKRLSDGLRKSKFAELTQKTEANACFVKLPKAIVSKLRDIAFFYVWDEHTFECRLMTSWDTQPADIENFLSALEELGRNTAGENRG